MPRVFPPWARLSSAPGSSQAGGALSGEDPQAPDAAPERRRIAEIVAGLEAAPAAVARGDAGVRDLLPAQISIDQAEQALVAVARAAWLPRAAAPRRWRRIRTGSQVRRRRPKREIWPQRKIGRRQLAVAVRQVDRGAPQLEVWKRQLEGRRGGRRIDLDAALGALLSAGEEERSSSDERPSIHRRRRAAWTGPVRSSSDPWGGSSRA